MEFILKTGVKQPKAAYHIILSRGKGENLKEPALKSFRQAIREKFAQGIPFVNILAEERSFLVVNISGKGPVAEAIRMKGAEAAEQVNFAKAEEVHISSPDFASDQILLFVEGLMLASYTFTRYKKEKGIKSRKISLSEQADKSSVTELENLIRAVYKARDLVNEPASYLTAEMLGKEICKMGKEAGFKAEVLEKKQLAALRFGGLLGVNAGSEHPPVFIILEYKPARPVNKKPLVLVGKGVVFDTGGLSLKPPHGMEHMKADMGGAAAVAGTFYAAAANQLDVHLIGLIPATDNRPGQKAIAPGDVITIYGGKTVEVLNTDAEGRLILADALEYAAKYKPELVVDLATLTGAAARAIGPEGFAMMGTAEPAVRQQLQESGHFVHERLVEFPLWPEYLKYLQSDIADLKNVGPGDAGAITAGKFLEQFTSFPWIHLDIAGMAFLAKADGYRPKNGTAVGVRLLYHFLKTYKK